MNLSNSKNHNPDILSCLANLSSDEVFTPPEIANRMLDLLPADLFTDPEAKFLDPACKTGVFLREIAKRLIVGLEDKIPDLGKRLNHIFNNQIYGIAITHLTSLLSRRSLYCSKDAGGNYSVASFTGSDGNIRYKSTEHVWRDGYCDFCGVNEKQYRRGADLETHAYEFIHTKNPEDILKMKFDCIISNPPYQLSDGGHGASARPIYQKFVEAALELDPKYICMIIPSRWMTGGKGLDDFRSSMIHDKHIRVIHDFADSKECFTGGVDIKGGVCYFLRDRDSEGMCDVYRHSIDGVRYSERYLVEEGDNFFIRDDRLISIKNKVASFGERSFSDIVSPLKPYGLRGDFFNDPTKYHLPPILEKVERESDYYRIIGLDEKQKRIYRYIPKDYPLPKKEGLNSYKIFITRNYGCGEIGEVPSTPVLSTPGELCTETFLQIGPFENAIERDNAFSYIKTKFFRTLVGILKQDQGAARGVYSLVPMQDFSKPWTDEELYRKYGLTDEEIEFIEKSIKPME